MRDADLAGQPLDVYAFQLNTTPAEVTFECHKDHRPVPEVVHHHHVLVQAWQEHFAPLGLSGAFGAEGAIWEPTTVLLPPSCHYAVHNRLVALMRAYAAARITYPELSQSDLLDRVVAEHPHGHGNLAEIAERSPREWLERGLSVDSLVQLRLWGQL